MAVSKITGIFAVDRILLKLKEGRGTVHRRHHHIQQDSVRVVLFGALHALQSRVGQNDLPASNRFQAQSSNLADIFFVINDEYAACHKSWKP